jgi:hypothetical protein
LKISVPPRKFTVCETTSLKSGTLPDTWKNFKKDGSVIDVEITAFPLVFDGRNAQLITATDVTARVSSWFGRL